MNIFVFFPYIILGLLIYIIYSIFSTGRLMRGIIAGDITKEKIGLWPKFCYSMSGYSIDGNKKIGDFVFCAYLKGNSLEKFDLPNNTKVLCNNVSIRDIRRGDILILETVVAPNIGKPKGRKCLGFWGDPAEPDSDLMEIEGFSGSVEEYFLKIAPGRYNYPKPYTGPIAGQLKTLSCDQEGQEIKVSRPHDPEKVIARVEYVCLPKGYSSQEAVAN